MSLVIFFAPSVVGIGAGSKRPISSDPGMSISGCKSRGVIVVIEIPRERNADGHPGSLVHYPHWISNLDLPGLEPLSLDLMVF